jgi:site-specific DNA-methyltransferase (adenine-specific)
MFQVYHQVFKIKKNTYSLKSLRFLNLIHQVVEGDSCNEELYSNMFTGTHRADLLLTDPPYCLLERRRSLGDLRELNHSKRVRKIDSFTKPVTVPRFKDVNSYKSFSLKWMKPCVENALKENAILIIWTNALGKTPIISVCKDLGYELYGEFIWAKKTSNPKGNVSKDILPIKNEILLRVYETALIFQRPNLEGKIGEHFNSLPWSVVTGYQDDFATSAHSHPCHKPIAAIEPLIRFI